MYALDKVSMIVRERVVIQSLTRGEPGEIELADDYVLTDTEMFSDPRFPKMFFIEKNYVHDASNWWIPNEAGLGAMVRSAGLTIAAHPDVETFVCEPTQGFNRWWMK
jgi:tRNA (mo5U34)-methyltransferase